jgi:CYTH domain-containing protein
MPIETEHKWLVRSLPQLKDYPAGVMPRFSTISQVYKTPDVPGTVERVRHRWYRGTPARHVYTRTVKTPRGHGSSDEDEHTITTLEYARALTAAETDPTYTLRTKYRTVFDWNGLTWELDEFQSGLAVLELEVPDLLDDPDLPPWLDVGEEVTGNALYANAVISRRTWNADYQSRDAFLAVLRQRVQMVLAIKGLAILPVKEDSTHNEWWYKAYEPDGLFVRFRDWCESPQHDFHLSCMVGQGDRSLSFWHEDQGDRSPTQIAQAIIEHLRVDGLRDGWLPEETPGSLLAEASDATCLFSSHRPLREHPAFKRLVAKGPSVAKTLFAIQADNCAVLGRGSRRRGLNPQPQDPVPGPHWSPLVALRTIFGDEGPEIPPEHAGRLLEIHRLWWEWGKERGLTPY